jgi:uncharacterized repeat protein (TIGR03803 family)
MQRALIVCLLCVAATASSAQTLTVLANFDYTDGSSPLSRLVQGLDGKLYGTTSEGGAGFYGTVFAFSAAGQIATLHSFAVADGAYPDTALVQAPNGNFYSTTNEGGSKGCGGFGCGTVFSITPRGKLTPLHIFDGTDGLLPEGLLEASNGNFYGFTDQGGPASACTVGCGTIFKVTPAGKFSTVLNFDGADGDLAAGVLVQGADGDYYGTTFGGGAEGIGTIFKITPAGTLTTLYSFCRCASGYGPDAGLVETANGDFYGTTSMGGTYGFGTIFKFTASGALTGLYSFDALDGPAALVVATDGNLYGTTIHGGTSSECVGNCGFIYRMTPFKNLPMERGLPDAVLVFHQREAHVTLAQRAEADARRDGLPALSPSAAWQTPASRRAIAFGQRRPHEHGAARLLHRPTGAIETAHQHIAALLVDGANLAVSSSHSRSAMMDAIWMGWKTP